MSQKKRTYPPVKPAKSTERTTRITVIVIICVVIAVVVGVAIYQSTKGSGTSTTPPPSTPTSTSSEPASPSTAPATPDQGQSMAPMDVLIRPDSHTLNDVPNAKVTFVEFLDFECSACALFYPALEQVRAKYGADVSFVVRYFPLEMHPNGMNSARAVEAAAQQGQFVAMYTKMFESQAEWANQSAPMDNLFRQYAQGLGLNMAAWDAAYASPATEARIMEDFNDGITLGVGGTPTFFLDGKVIGPRSVAELESLVGQAVEASR